MEKPKTVWKRLQLIGPFLVIPFLFILNIDWVVIPSIQTKHLVILFWQTGVSLEWLVPQMTFWDKIFAVCSISVFGSVYTYWFLGWFGRLLMEFPEIRKDVDFGEKVKGVLIQGGIWGWVKGYALSRYQSLTHEDNGAVKKIKKWGYLGILMIGAFPEYGGRTAIIAFCRMINWRSGFILLLLVDVFKNFYMVLGWGVVLK